MPVSSPSRQAASTTTKARLLKTAQTQFLASGYEATTVRLIAKGASVTIGAFYGHFDSKRTALFEVVRAINTKPRKNARFVSAPERSLVLAVASFAHTDPEAAAVLGELIMGSTEHPATLDAVQIGEFVTALTLPIRRS